MAPTHPDRDLRRRPRVRALRRRLVERVPSHRRDRRTPPRRTLEPAYGFSSLFRFKAKFNPEYETLSMAYPDPLALPVIVLAIGRAYLPDVTPKEAVAIVRRLTS
ncbi:hypothetical protein GCM10023152_07160 [Agromyces bauzanensis]|uniref:Uncharacterized protein n=1 Tax=Agromyces bauzanensis TaxID=1308924 RepID=A0A917PJG4_9MICO|nr:hypothetical protein GCM10011372_19230 [Agromyces bauzanensis]